MNHAKAYEAGIKYFEVGQHADLSEALESFTKYCGYNGWDPVPYRQDVRDGWESASEGSI
jgi:hypothetical protein